MIRLPKRKERKYTPKPSRYPRQPLTARHLVLTDEMRTRGGHKSRRRTARTWRAA